MELMKPEIKCWDCTDHDPIDGWIPDDPEMVNYWCNVAIGIEGETGADNFQVHVVTEKMMSQIEDKEYLIILPYYEGWSQVLDAINQKIAGISELSWAGISEKLSKLFYWEYEGYKR